MNLLKILLEMLEKDINKYTEPIWDYIESVAKNLK